MGMVHNRGIVRLRGFLRRSLRVLGWETSRDVEYNFTRRNVVGEGVSVLDVGGCESLLNLHFADTGMKVTVCDFREYPEKHPNLSSLRGDFLKSNLPAGSFDFVTFVSAIEHFGFGGYGDPEMEDADFQAIALAARALKPGGRIVLTFPFAGSHRIVPGFERWYDIGRVRRLFFGMSVLAEEYYIPAKKVMGRWVHFAPASLETVSRETERLGCQGFACYVVSPSPRANFP